MGEKEDKEKADKLAAAKKRVAQLQKKKKAAAGGDAGESAGAKSKPKSKKSKVKEKEDADNEVEDGDADGDKAAQEDDAEQPDVQTKEDIDVGSELGDADEAAFNEAIQAAGASQADGEADEQETDKVPEPSSVTSPLLDSAAVASSRKHSARQPSISQQSKARSTSFRQGADPNAPLSPSAEEGADESLYRKQSLRIEELEEENKRLSKEAREGEARWRKSEETLEELREKNTEEYGASSQQNEEIEKLREEVSVLRRNSRASVSKGAATTSDDNIVGLKKELEEKESTISDLQLEVSRLRGQVSRQNEGSDAHGEQVSALQSNLERAEAHARKLEIELTDSKKALGRASEKAVLEGTEKTSKETKINSLERENEELKAARQDLEKKAEALEKKIEAMNKLHRETEQRNASKLTTAEAQAREAAKLEAKVLALTEENSKLKEVKRKTMVSGADGDDDGLDELEDEARGRLQQRIRDLEGEVFELRRGVWRDKRKELQPGMTEKGNSGIDGGDADDFDEVDLSGSGALSRRRSTASGIQQQQQKHSGFTQVLNSGIAAFRSTTISPDYSQQPPQPSQSHGRPRNDSLLQDFDGDDDDMAFDEQAFASAQREEEMKKMVEQVREVKRGLKNWVGWRLDLVDSRRGGGGFGVGEVFDL